MPEQEKTRALWRVRLEKAKAEYDLAVAEFRRSAEEYRLREAGSPEAARAFQSAIAAEQAARERYVAALRRFTDLSLPKD